MRVDRSRLQNIATDSATKAARTLARDEDFKFRAAHWGDLHRRLHEELPPAVTVLWGHQFLSFEAPDDTRGVVATARVLRTGGTVEATGDLLIAADGSTSSVRRSFLPDLKLRFSCLRVWFDDLVQSDPFLTRRATVVGTGTPGTARGEACLISAGRRALTP